jgi:hypothetical protein
MQPSDRRFRQVYARKGWATAGVLSGNGSRVEHCTELARWLQRMADEEGLASVCDLGCGDLEWICRVPAITGRVMSYHGVDVVAALVAHHRRIFPWFRGEVADLESVIEERPGRAADVVLLKDVLFHLCSGAAEQVLMNAGRWARWRRLLASTHTGVDNAARRGLKGAGALPYDAEAAMRAVCPELGAPALRFPRPDGGEWVVWER